MQKKFPLNTRDLLLFYVLYYCTLNLFGFWAVGQIRQAVVTLYSGKLSQAFFFVFTIFCHFIDNTVNSSIKITNRLNDNENNL